CFSAIFLIVLFSKTSLISLPKGLHDSVKIPRFLFSSTRSLLLKYGWLSIYFVDCVTPVFSIIRYKISVKKLDTQIDYNKLYLCSNYRDSQVTSYLSLYVNVY